MPQHPKHQLEAFRLAIAALGGQKAAGQRLGLGDRHLRNLLAGDALIHPAHLAALGRALIEHADECRKLERQLSPAFAANLTAAQLARQGAPDRRRFDQRPLAQAGAAGSASGEPHG